MRSLYEKHDINTENAAHVGVSVHFVYNKPLNGFLLNLVLLVYPTPSTDWETGRAYIYIHKYNYALRRTLLHERKFDNISFQKSFLMERIHVPCS